MEKLKEYNISLHHLFIDFRAACNSMNTENLCAPNKKFGFSGKLTRMIHVTENSTCSVGIQSSLSARFGKTNGARQSA